MSKKKSALSTEERIKQTAKKLFFGQGNFKAGTQEIADAAGVNRTAINYYFRSRDNLLKIVFDDALNRMQEDNSAIVSADLPFREKLEKWLDDKLATAIKYPFLELYIVSEMQTSSCAIISKNKEFLRSVNDILADLLREEAAKGTIKPIDPIHFILNIASLVSFPFCMRPLLAESLDIDEAQFKQIMEERKQVILDSVFI